MPGYDCHASPHVREWWLPGELRALPVYVLEIKAFARGENVKGDDGLGAPQKTIELEDEVWDYFTDPISNKVFKWNKKTDEVEFIE